MAALQKNPFFDQVILEREGERQGSGVDFDYTLSVANNPPPYQPLPKGPAQPKVAAPAQHQAAPQKGIAVPPPAASRAVPVTPAAPAASPAPASDSEPPANRPPQRFHGRSPARRVPIRQEGDE